MRIVTAEKATFSSAFGIDMAEIGKLIGSDIAASFGRVALGCQTPSHQHDEVEAFVVLRGRGEVVVNNVSYPVEPGVITMFEPFESHILRNRGSVELLFMDLYRR